MSTISYKVVKQTSIPTTNSPKKLEKCSDEWYSKSSIAPQFKHNKASIIPIYHITASPMLKSEIQGQHSNIKRKVIKIYINVSRKDRLHSRFQVSTNIKTYDSIDINIGMKESRFLIQYSKFCLEWVASLFWQCICIW